MTSQRAASGKARTIPLLVVRTMATMAEVAITLKDFRTLCASAAVLEELSKQEPAKSQAGRKRQVKEAVKAIDRFESALAAEAKSRDFDGVVCGHIHVAAIKPLHGIAYVNCGDWVDSCTAVVEHLDGRMELVRWGLASATKAPLEPAATAAA